MGGKEGRREEKRHQGEGGAYTSWIHFGIHLLLFFTILRQPSGNHLATKRQPKTLGLISRDRIGPISTVAKFPWKWYDFSINSRGRFAKAVKKKAQE